MKEFVQVKCSLYCSMPEEVALCFHARAEIEYAGYALLAFQIGSKPRLFGTTLGLSFLGHPEILSDAGEAEDVLPLLKYLADQVVEHDYVFTEGKHSTPLFKELSFAKNPENLSKVGMIREILDGFEATWLFCQEPLGFKTLSSAA